MTIEHFREALKRKPFLPFKIHVSGGKPIEVRHPDFVAQSPTGRTVFVLYGDDHFEIIDLMLVTRLEVGSAPRKQKNGRRS